MQPQFTSFNPYQQQAQQEAMQVCTFPMLHSFLVQFTDSHRQNICDNSRSGSVTSKNSRLNNNKPYYSSNNRRSGCDNSRLFRLNKWPRYKSLNPLDLGKCGSIMYIPSPLSSSIAQTIRLHPRYPLRQCRQHRVELMEQATDLFSTCRARLPAPMRPHTHRHLHPHRPPPRRLERILQALVFQARVPPVLTRSTRTSRPCSPIATMDKIPLETLVCFGTDTRRLAGPLRRRYLVVASTTPLRRRTSNSLSRVTIMSSPSFLYNGVRFLYRSWMGCDLLGFILFVFPP